MSTYQVEQKSARGRREQFIQFFVRTAQFDERNQDQGIQIVQQAKREWDARMRKKIREASVEKLRRWMEKMPDFLDLPEVRKMFWERVHYLRRNGVQI